MSYARRGPDSDVDVFRYGAEELCCRRCRLNGDEDQEMSDLLMLDHLRAHEEAGDRVPGSVFVRLQTETTPRVTAYLFALINLEEVLIDRGDGDIEKDHRPVFKLVRPLSERLPSQASEFGLWALVTEADGRTYEEAKAKLRTVVSRLYEWLEPFIEWD